LASALTGDGATPFGLVLSCSRACLLTGLLRRRGPDPTFACARELAGRPRRQRLPHSLCQVDPSR
jgi:hypothetical protein